KGDMQSAIRHFNDALAIDPREPVALRELALLDIRTGQYARACGRLKVVVEQDPFDPETHFNYARALKLAGDEDRSREETLITTRLRKEHAEIASVRIELMRNPKDPALRGRAAQWLLDHGHEKEGLEWTELILRDHPHHEP